MISFATETFTERSEILCEIISHPLTNLVCNLFLLAQSYSLIQKFCCSYFVYFGHSIFLENLQTSLAYISDYLAYANRSQVSNAAHVERVQNKHWKC